MLIRIPRGWEIPERTTTPEDVYLNRRKISTSAGNCQHEYTWHIGWM